MNTIKNNNRKDNIKKWNGETDDVDHRYIGDKYKDLIDNVFKSRLKDGDSRLTEFHNRKLALTNVANNYLEKRSWCGW